MELVKNYILKGIFLFCTILRFRDKVRTYLSLTQLISFYFLKSSMIFLSEKKKSSMIFTLRSFYSCLAVKKSSLRNQLLLDKNYYFTNAIISINLI
jgi:hypothetical protein